MQFSLKLETQISQFIVEGTANSNMVIKYLGHVLLTIEMLILQLLISLKTL